MGSRQGLNLPHELDNLDTTIQCASIASGSGFQCKHPAMPGSTFCRVHGGASRPLVRAKRRNDTVTMYSQQKMMRHVQRELRALGSTENYEDPMQGLLREVQVSALAVRAYERMLTSGNNEADILWHSNRDDFAPEVHPVVVLWNQERDRHAKLCKLAIDAGIADRFLRIQEGQARSFVAITISALEDPSLNLDPRQQLQLRKLIAQRVRAFQQAAIPVDNAEEALNHILAHLPPPDGMSEAGLITAATHQGPQPL